MDEDKNGSFTERASRGDGTHKPVHVLLRNRLLSAFGILGAVFALGITLILADYVPIGWFLSMLSALGTAWLYHRDIRQFAKTHRSTEVLIAVGLIILELLLPPYLAYSRAKRVHSGQTSSLSGVSSNNPCVQLRQFDMKCSADDFAEAISAGNKDAIKLEIEGGVNLETQGVHTSALNHLEFATPQIQDYVLGLLKKQGFTGTSHQPCSDYLFDDDTGMGRTIQTKTLVGCELVRKTKLYCALKRIGLSDPSFEEAVTTDSRKRIAKAGAIWEKVVKTNCGQPQLYGTSNYEICDTQRSNFEHDHPTQQGYVDYVSKLMSLPEC